MKSANTGFWTHTSCRETHTSCRETHTSCRDGKHWQSGFTY